MNISVRSRLTLVIVSTFLITLLLITAMFFFVYRNAIQQDMISELDEDIRRVEILVSQFLNEMNSTPSTRHEAIKSTFLEQLESITTYQNRVAILRVNLGNILTTYSAGGVKNLQFLLPKGIFDEEKHDFNLVLAEKEFFCLRTETSWGMLVVGKERLQLSSSLFRSYLFILIPLIVFALLIVGNFLARLVLKPALEAAKAADTISLGNQEARLPVYEKNDEFAQLVNTLNNLIERLQNGADKIQQFTQDAAHELRTPLTTLRGELELLYQSEEMSESSRAPLQRSLDRAIYMNNIVDNLLLLAHSDSGAYPLQQTSFLFTNVIDEIVEDVQILLEDSSVSIELEADRSISITADKPLIGRLAYSIIENAVKFTDRGSIKVCIKPFGEEILFSVADTGIGISEDRIPHIFERFYRGGSQIKQPGTGLGLSIARWIVHAHEGRIEVKSRVNEGTTVSVYLPLNT